MSRQRWPLDPDPLTVDPEPVRRRLLEDPAPSSTVIIGIVLVTIAILAAASLISNATPRSAPEDGPGHPSDAPGLSGAPDSEKLAGAPRYAGTATWYCSSVATCTRGYRPGDLIAAIKDSAFRKGDRVLVRSQLAGERSVTVTIVDTCACAGTRLIDLSRAAFARLANPDLGVIPVTLELAGALPTGPATDVEP